MSINTTAISDHHCSSRGERSEVDAIKVLKHYLPLTKT